MTVTVSVFVSFLYFLPTVQMRLSVAISHCWTVCVSYRSYDFAFGRYMLIDPQCLGWVKLYYYDIVLAASSTLYTFVLCLKGLLDYSFGPVGGAVSSR